MNGLKDIFSLFRAVVQERGNNVSYIVSGSRVHMLNEILSNGKSPLFTHFEKMLVCEMDKKHSIELVTKYLKAKKIAIRGSISEEIFDTVGGVPFYLMAVAEELGSKQDVKDAYYTSLTDSLGTLKNYVDYILSEDLGVIKGGPILRTILRALAMSDTGLGYSDISKKIGVSMSKLPFYMGNLQKSDIIIQDSKKFRVRDKIVRDYLKIEAEELA